MSHKRVARLLQVNTNSMTGELYVTTIPGSLETIPLDGRWNQDTIREKITDAIQKRKKNGIVKRNVGYAIYKSTGHGLQLQSVHIQSEFSHLPCKWL